MKNYKLLFFIIVILSIPSVLFAKHPNHHKKISQTKSTPQKADSFTSSISLVPDNIKKQMTGHSWQAGCPITLDQLAYLKLSYWGFDNKIHQGELVVYKLLAKETVDIFKQLFAIKFPIANMQLPENLPANKESLELNNTYAFYCRSNGQNPGKLSRHSYGLAIDINPLYNPEILNKEVKPEMGRLYIDRQLQHQGMIKEGDAAFTIFLNHGWVWGGYFKQANYMHFDKFLTKHYLVEKIIYIPPELELKTLGDL
jgi:hypothetical protein